jgi:hypothetical protein
VGFFDGADISQLVWTATVLSLAKLMQTVQEPLMGSMARKPYDAVHLLVRGMFVRGDLSGPGLKKGT